MNGQGPGIWIEHRDESGLVSSVSIIVRPCVNEPPETVDDSTFRPWLHGLACYVFDDGATLMCAPCGRARLQDEARQRRLNRLPPAHREWLARRGIHDWNPGGER